MRISPSTRVILVNTYHNDNVGAAARAMKTMGFDDLALVSPRDPKVCNRAKTIQRASGATDVLRNAKVYSHLDDALEGMNIWCGTGMPNDMFRKRQKRIYENPRNFFERVMSSRGVPATAHSFSGEEQINADGNKELQKSSNEEVRLALIFGSEHTGMEDVHMDKCHALLGIPTNPAFGSLNLAAAVQLIAYDWRVAIGGEASYDDYDDTFLN